MVLLGCDENVSPCVTGLRSRAGLNHRANSGPSAICIAARDCCFDPVRFGHLSIGSQTGGSKPQYGASFGGLWFLVSEPDRQTTLIFRGTKAPLLHFDLDVGQDWCWSKPGRLQNQRMTHHQWKRANCTKDEGYTPES